VPEQGCAAREPENGRAGRAEALPVRVAGDRYIPPVAHEGTVWLVGMMGAGKSAVGAALARLLGTAFVDVDREVEAAAGASIAELFARHGEPAFRRLEREAWERVAGKPVVAALGGGAPAEPGAAERLAATGVVVYLRARPATLLARLGDAASRPLLRDRSPQARAARLSELLEARRGAYERAALVVDTDEIDVDAVAARLAEQLRGWP
jgi:shikimate kinase